MAFITVTKENATGKLTDKLGQTLSVDEFRRLSRGEKKEEKKAPAKKKSSKKSK